MAMELGQQSLTLTYQERTWRVEIFCEQGDDPTIVVHRERLGALANGTVVSRDRDIPPVRRALAQIAEEAQHDITGQQLAGIIADRADLWRQQDIETAAEQQQEGGE